ncbi:MAG TPA: DUF1080 domain-containing protein [Planctomycetaceae bacterium]|nr:DUF1080 domain-containing protein [Planctomycetaceae bacterium]
MRRFLLVLVAILLSHTVALPAQAADRKPNELTRAEIEAGWIRLFDGESLFGWKPNSKVDWHVRDGIIEASEGEPGLLVTTTEFSDYELLCDFNLVKGGNSGVFLQTVFQPKDPAKDCYELNLCDTRAKFGTGSFVGRQEPVKALKTEGEWHTFHVTAHGAKIQVRLDGAEILAFDGKGDDCPMHGFIGLQKNEGHVQFRNVFLRPLGLKPIFNGKDLSGWRVVPGGKSKFDVQDGAIHVTNGRGYLETEQTWADFVMQADVISNGKHLNSGFFFRALPGTEKNPAEGYESQIRNEWTGDDRNKPVDFGTGGIYRRVPTRRVVSSDHQWFTETLIAQGAHIAVWIDGYQTADWTDTRAPNENARNGLRLEAGHISLQGHDPTTDLSFKNLRIVPVK